jgi:hypothetical protein
VPLGKLGRKIITDDFRSTGLLRQERFEKHQLSGQLGGKHLRQAGQDSSAVLAVLD